MMLSVMPQGGDSSLSPKQSEARKMFKCPRSCLMTLAKGELREHILLYIRHCICCDHVSGGPRQGLSVDTGHPQASGQV